ncbi:putative serine/threonine-protein kinase clkA [Aphis craccivora]|uniref:Putative serine/threonine-protein kinase clkA n=1 Tax=Aphis craccivora TaxID=307492 RepID=A0A6G0VPT3_APHCR|nr:putative serine/threonine-protein kinase clkA [Aphis craccivora]
MSIHENNIQSPNENLIDENTNELTVSLTSWEKFIYDNINMTDKTPFYKPNKFSGAIHENVNSFIKIYNKARATNGWSSEQKKFFLPIYLENTAATFLDNFENSNPTTTWEQIEQALRLEFEPTA